MFLKETNPFLTAWDAAWAPLSKWATPKALREHFEVLARAMRMPTPDGVTTMEFTIAVPANSGTVRVRALIPAGTGRRPGVIYMHGDAFIQDSPETRWDITSRMAAWNNPVVISVHYALVPERPFPEDFNDMVAVVRWAFGEGAAILGFDAVRIAIAADSAGANLAAAATIFFRETRTSSLRSR